MKPSSAQRKSALTFLAGIEILPKKALKGGDVFGRVVCHVKLSACVLSCDSRESL